MTTPSPSLKLNELLKSKREQKRVSLQTAHQDTRISTVFLEALESGQYEQFPAEVYCIGFLKKYAQYLGMDPNEAVALYRSEQDSVFSVQKVEEEKKIEHENEEKSTDLVKVVSLIAILSLLGVWGLFSMLSSSSKKQAKKTPTIAQRGMASVSPDPSHTLTLIAHAKNNVWMRILPDKKLNFEGFMLAGSSRTWVAKGQIFIRIGNVEEVTLTLNGKGVDIQTGAVRNVNEILLTRDSLKEEPPKESPLPKIVQETPKPITLKKPQRIKKVKSKYKPTPTPQEVLDIPTDLNEPIFP